MSPYLPIRHGTNMVQIYNKNRVIQDRYYQVLKTKKVRNPLSFTPFPMDVYRYLSILT
ncbi:hypothetical protein EVA_02435 [gut metagenome]|uniref:Uncharacterized protein n=1 Tax=gut metagenome TaxID=749906 RepID=J9GN16_9ZZZZ